MARLGRHLERSLCSLVLICAAFSAPPPAAGPVAYETARRLFESEHLGDAAVAAQHGFDAAPAGSKLAWDFRLLRAEILLANRKTKLAKADLDAGAPPAGPDFAEQTARYRLCQAYEAALSERFDDARARLVEARRLAESLPAPRLLAEIELREGYVAIYTGDLVAAQKHLLHVLDFATAHNDSWLRMIAAGNMGFMFLHSGSYAEANPFLEQTLAQARALGAETSQARSLGNLGNYYFRLGDLDKAAQYLREAESRSASIGTGYDRQIWLGNLGNIEESRGIYDSATAYYGRALAMSKDLGLDSWTATWTGNLARVAIDRGNWDDAERYNNQALSLEKGASNADARAYSLVNAGFIAEGRNQFRLAEKAFARVLLSPPHEPRPLLDAHYGLAEAYAAEHSDGAAKTEFKKALNVVARQQGALLNEGDKLTWFSSLIHFYQQYVEFLMIRGRTEAALDVVQSSRGRVLASRLRAGEPHVTITASELSNMAARSASTFLFYWVAPRKSYAWAVTGAGIREFDLPPAAQLVKLVGDYGRFVQELHDPLHEADPAGDALYRTLVAPAGVATSKVMLAPDGPLYELNFATLPVQGAQAPHYWIEDAELSIIPSFESQRATRPRAPRSLLLMGDPVSADAEFPRLEFAGQEMAGIQQSLPGVRRAVYSGDRASPKAYAQAKPGEFSWIHFVAHGTANRDEPLQSAVILSRDPGGDFRLFAGNALKIPLTADLVTVSACRSAGTKVFAGEGLVGFSWAFLKSGARNVIAGLWDVNDRSTAQMMTALYAELGRGAAPASALRAAELTMIRSAGVYRKPFYWGPFEVFRSGELGDRPN